MTNERKIYETLLDNQLNLRERMEDIRQAEAQARHELATLERDIHGALVTDLPSLATRRRELTDLLAVFDLLWRPMQEADYKIRRDLEAAALRLRASEAEGQPKGRGMSEEERKIELARRYQ